MEDFDKIKTLIEKTQNNVIHLINKELITLYWNIGCYISEKVKSDGWGKSTVQNLAKYLVENFEGNKGFSAQNLWRMKQFYDLYNRNKKLSPLVRELSWTNNLLIISGTKTDEEREFYIRTTIKERYSKRELERQINSCFFERAVIANNKKTSKLIPSGGNEDVFNLSGIRDSYMLEFLSLPSNFKEKDLQKQITENLKNFILEFGKDFIFIGNEYRVQVGNEDFFIDLLFYHRQLNCLVALELKIGKFQPEYLGKMNFYLEALDRDVRKPHENPSIGIILCTSYEKTVVEYSLSRNISPMMVSEYKTKLIDKTILQNKLKEFYELAQESLGESNEINDCADNNNPDKNNE
jgi:predicted nuclease of restriction endonuclease-like (RecB) superfamily